ncbi:MAG: hypothetical protein WAU70_08335 [Flavobacteriales bacterium]
MNIPNDRRVEIVEKGREGSVIYREALNGQSFYWEFGGGEVLAIIQADRTWKTPPSWMAGRQAEILRFVADEVIRQKAPGGSAEIDEVEGTILLRAGAVRQPRAKTHEEKRTEAAAWMGRYRRLRVIAGVVVLIGGLVVAALFWFKNTVLVIDPGKGTPFGRSVRSGEMVATLIQSLVPYTPSLNRDHSKDEYRMSLFLVSTDGSSAPRMIPVTGKLRVGSYSLGKILGGDGRSMWYDVNGIGGVDLRTGERITEDDLRKVNPTPAASWWNDAHSMVMNGKLRITARDRSQSVDVDPQTLRAVPATTKDEAAWPFDIEPTAYLCSGLFTSPTQWLGLHSPAEVERGFKPKSWLRRIERADDKKEMRQFHRGVLDPLPAEGRDDSPVSLRIISMTPLDSAHYLNAAFLRVDEDSEPLHLADPDGALMIFTSVPGLKGTVVVARVDTAGRFIWKVDTGIDRFKLSQILPGKETMVFIGTRPMIPDQLSEPLLVIVNNSTGKTVTHSLWQ